jgi:hypothetical protein
MQNLLVFAPMMRATGTIALPADGVRLSLIDARDFAEVAAIVLTGRGHEGRAYQLSGPTALGFAELAEHPAAATGRVVRYLPVSPGEAAATIRARGAADFAIDTALAHLVYWRTGVGAQMTSAAQRLLDRCPRTFAMFAADHAALIAAPKREIHHGPNRGAGDVIGLTIDRGPGRLSRVGDPGLGMERHRGGARCELPMRSLADLREGGTSLGDERATLLEFLGCQGAELLRHACSPRRRTPATEFTEPGCPFQQGHVPNPSVARTPSPQPSGRPVARPVSGACGHHSPPPLVVPQPIGLRTVPGVRPRTQGVAAVLAMRFDDKAVAVIDMAGGPGGTAGL